MDRIATHKGGKDEVVFSEHAMEYRGTEISYADATSIAFSKRSGSGGVRYTSHATVLIRSRDSIIRIKFSNNGVTLSGAKWKAIFALDAGTNYPVIAETVAKRVGPYILTRMVKAIMEGRSIKIGSLEFDYRGITSFGVLGTRKRAAWNQLPEVRSTAKTPWYSYTKTSGIVEISYHYPPTGQMVVIGTTSSAEDNGCLVMALVEAIKMHLAS